MAISATTLALSKHLSAQQGFDTKPKHNENCLFVIEDYAEISVEGIDAEKFLQGQLSCDVAKIDNNHSSRGAHCNPKGRAVASFTMAKIADNHFGLKLPEDNIDNLAKSLGKYIVFSKAKISTEPRHVFLGISGPKAKSIVENHFEPSEANTYRSASGIAIALADQRFELWLNESEAESLWPQLLSEFTPKAYIFWKQQQINAGLCDIRAAIRDEFIPQMFGLKEDDGISYKKGCYTGQEIVARLHFLGQQKRILAKFEASSDTHAIGDVIKSDNGKTLGSVVDVADNIGLAVISNSALEASTAILNNETISLQSLAQN